MDTGMDTGTVHLSVDTGTVHLSAPPNTLGSPCRTWRCGKHQLRTDPPLLMGILNVTPDSFSDGGEHADVRSAIEHAHMLISDGADIIDVGGESTRPGASDVAWQDELNRVLPVVRALAAEGAVVSIDTRKSEVAAACVAAGAAIINDVSGFRQPSMQDLACECGAGLVVMHMQGEPRIMQDEPSYVDVVSEVDEWLHAQANMLVQRGVSPERICLDPGPGFGKSFMHNLALLEATSAMAARAAASGYQWMAAWSRKAFVGKLHGISDPAARDTASAHVAARAAAQGATVLRVHNVAATLQALGSQQTQNPS